MVAYRELAKQAGVLKECARCGYDNALVMEVHHKDRNRGNNAIENLEVLCANCHRLEHDSDRRQKRGRTKPLTSQVNMRVPEVLLARIDSAAGEDGRSKWILEACRMRLDCLQAASDPIYSSHNPSKDNFEINPSVDPKAIISHLRDICDGKLQPHNLREIQADESGIPYSVQSEIPICGKTWWEDVCEGGERVQFECLMDKGHREALAGKHGLRGMVRRLDA